MEGTKVIVNIVVVLNYNDADTVIKYIRQIQKYNCLDKIIIVDNCSTDDSAEQLQSICNDNIMLTESPVNKGYAAGNNYGIRFAERMFPQVRNIIISNPDITICEDDIIKIFSAFEHGFDLATGLIFNDDSNKLVSNFAWRIPKYSDMISNCFLSIYKFRRSFLKNNIYYEYVDIEGKRFLKVEAVPGCFFAIKDSTIRAVNYFDEDTFLYEEETILGKKLLDYGFNVCVVNNTHIVHAHSTSIKKSIKSQKHNAKILLDSESVFIKKYLQCGIMKQILYPIVYWIGFFEKTGWNLFLKQRKK